MPSEERGRPAVVSQFFSKSSTSQQSSKESRNGLKKQTSIISLSSSDDAEDNDIQVIETAPAVVVAGQSSANKRKAVPISGTSKTPASASQEPASKKVKVAPLFERVKHAGANPSFAVKKEDDAATVQRLQQWKFANGTNGNSSGTPPPDTANTSHKRHSFSPLPDIAASSQAVQARRAQVRKLLLGIDTEWRKPPDEEAEAEASHADDSGDANDDSLMEDEPVASSSNGRTQGKASKKPTEDSLNTPDFSRFAAEKSKKGKSVTTTSKKGKAKAPEPAVKYTPLEQQVIDIKQKYVCRWLFLEATCLSYYILARHVADCGSRI